MRRSKTPSASAFSPGLFRFIANYHVAAPKQHNTDGEKRDIKAASRRNGRRRRPSCPRKDRDARWTVKYTTAKPSEDGAPRVDLAIPAFGKNYIGIDRRHGLIHRWTVTDAARHEGAPLPELIDRDNTASEVWADTAYRSKANEKHLADRLLRSQIHRKKPPTLTLFGVSLISAQVLPCGQLTPISS